MLEFSFPYIILLVSTFLCLPAFDPLRPKTTTKYLTDAEVMQKFDILKNLQRIKQNDECLLVYLVMGVRCFV